jgi:hypothetical protein
MKEGETREGTVGREGDGTGERKRKREEGRKE